MSDALCNNNNFLDFNIFFFSLLPFFALFSGNVGVLMANLSDVSFEIKKGDNIAQLVLEKYEDADVQEIDSTKLDSTTRGTKGFGSTNERKIK